MKAAMFNRFARYQDHHTFIQSRSQPVSRSARIVLLMPKKNLRNCFSSAPDTSAHQRIGLPHSMPIQNSSKRRGASHE